MVILLALAAAVAWGVADFGSGMKSRSVSSVTVSLLVFVVGGLGSLAIAAASEALPGQRTLLLALLAGVVTGFGVATFFRALAVGEIGVVAPIVAAGAAVPVVVGFARGERPSAAASIGVVLAIIGVVAMVSAPSAEPRPASNARLAMRLSAFASVALGTYYVIARAGGAHSPLWYAGVGQICAAAPLAVILLARHKALPNRRDLAQIVALGLANGVGWVCSVLALRHGLLALVSVLVALYPALTVLLALIFAGERLTGRQYLAGATILGGVAMIAAS
jgi:drug/metabolite transporter (DMT)-like permease